MATPSQHLKRLYGNKIKAYYEEMVVKRTSGANFSNSEIQLGRVERGAAIRNGPFTSRSISETMRATDWIVLPSPISSARIPLMPCSNNPSSQVIPSS